MQQFKIGDVVVRNQDADESFTWLDFVRTERPRELVVTSVAGNWIQVNGYTVINGNSHPFNTKFFSLVDDELPPAPESVLYNDEYPDRAAYDQTWLRTHLNQCESLITIQTGQYGRECVWVLVCALLLMQHYNSATTYAVWLWN